MYKIKKKKPFYWSKIPERFVQKTLWPSKIIPIVLEEACFDEEVREKERKDKRQKREREKERRGRK